MSSIKCKVGWHDWNKFGSLVLGYSNLCQFRECERCGLISYTKIYGDQAKVHEANNSIDT